MTDDEKDTIALTEIVLRENGVRNPNPSLVRALAKPTLNWMNTAKQHALNEDYYRGLVRRCGEAIGEEAYLTDAGERSQEVLCDKVPELVEKLAVTLETIRNIEFFETKPS